MSQNKIVKYRKPFKPKVATMILFIIIVYVVVVAWNYLKKDPVIIYEVNETNIADDSTITGFILRDEKVLYAKESGYVNFYHADQSKIGKNEVLYTIDQNGSISELLENVESKNQTSKDDITRMREVIQDYYSNFNPAAYYTINDFHYRVENTIFEQSRDNLYSDLKKQMNKEQLSNDFSKFRSKSSGIISYSIDGYENTSLNQIDGELFQQSASVERKQLSSSEQIEKDTPVCKLVTNEDWQIVIPLSEELAVKLRDQSAVRVTVKKDNISFNTGITIQNNNGEEFAVLSTGRFMGRYVNDRFLDIELKLNAASGFKIPNSSIVEKDMTIIPESMITTGGDKSGNGVIVLRYDKDGTASETFTELSGFVTAEGDRCIDSSVIKPGDIILNPADHKPYTLERSTKLPGVYCVNTGYCQFKRIEKKYENNEYTIVSPDTQNGISNFDHIVVNPEKINENDFVE